MPGAPLRFRKSEILRRETVRVDLVNPNPAVETLRYVLPSGVPGAWDLSTLSVMLELEIRNSAGNLFPQSDNQVDRVFAQEMLGSHVFAAIHARFNGTDVTDEDAGMRGYPDAYRKMLTRPAGWFASAFRDSVAAKDATRRYGPVAANAAVYSNFEADLRGGYQAGEFLDTAASAFVSAAKDGLQAVVGIGGPSDTRADPRKIARRRFLAGAKTMLAIRPTCAATALDSLVPCDVPIQFEFTKNGNAMHLLQAAPGTANLPNPRVTFVDAYLLVQRVIPKSTAQAALYRPIVAETTRHVFNSQVLPFSITGAASFNLQKLLVGPRPDMVLISITSDAAATGNTYNSVDAAGGTADNPPGWTLSLLGSGRGAAVTSNAAGDDRSAPYVTLTSFSARWGSESIPSSSGPIRQSDASQEALGRYYAMHVACAEKLGGAGLSFAEFVGHQVVCLDMSRELDEHETGSSADLSVDITLAQSLIDTTAPGVANTFRINVTGIWHGGVTSVVFGEHAPGAVGARTVERGW